MGKRRLTADDWTAEALRVIAESGLAAVAVEPLAARLGATKGSFYWHFTNREALIAAAADRWERAGTEDVIARVEDARDPTAKLRLLFGTVLTHAADGRLESNLMAAADHPLIGPVVQRVSARRFSYVEALFTEVGFPPDQARHRALLAYAAYVGQAQLAARVAGLLPFRADTGPYLSTVLGVLLAGRPETGTAEIESKDDPPRRTVRRRTVEIPRQLAEEVADSAALSRKTVDQFVADVLAREMARWDREFPLPAPPEDFQRALDSHPDAAAFFATLSRRNHYAILARIDEVKRHASRARRIEEAIAMLLRRRAPYRQ